MCSNGVHKPSISACPPGTSKGNPSRLSHAKKLERERVKSVVGPQRFGSHCVALHESNADERRQRRTESLVKDGQNRFRHSLAADSKNCKKKCPYPLAAESLNCNQRLLPNIALLACGIRIENIETTWKLVEIIVNKIKQIEKWKNWKYRCLLYLLPSFLFDIECLPRKETEKKTVWGILGTAYQ